MLKSSEDCMSKYTCIELLSIYYILMSVMGSSLSCNLSLVMTLLKFFFFFCEVVIGMLSAIFLSYGIVSL